MAAIRFMDVRKMFGDVVAVERLDLAVADGEFVVFVGPSGCGKTTSLRMLAGLDEVTAGHILVDGQDVTRVPPKARDMAMVFQNYALYPHMSVAENIGFALSLRGVARTEVASRVRRSAEMLEIAHLLGRRPKELSGGQRQRVAVCRAIVRDPKVFLFDEPLSNLDPQLRTSARGEIRSLQRRLGTTSVYVTHDQIEAMTMADRIVIMCDGRVQQIGTPEEVFERPANMFVAGFIGSPPMNLLSAASLGKVTDTLDSSVFANRAATVVGIRPEHIAFREPVPHVPCARVVQVEMIGTECLVHGEIGGETVTARVPRAGAPRAGDTVGLVWPDHEVHLFDAASGQRLKTSRSLAA